MAFPRRRPSDTAEQRATHLREVAVDPEFAQSRIALELSDARRRRGGDLQNIAEELRIRYDHLLALEEGRFDDLPGPTYVIGFLRSYAGYLDLDAEDLINRFKTEVSSYSGQQKLHFPAPSEEGRLPTGSLMIGALVLAGAGYAAWYYMTNVDRLASVGVPEVPARMATAIQPPEPTPTAPTDPEPAPTDIVQSPPLATATDPATGTALGEVAATSSAPATASMTDAPVQPELTAVAPATNAPTQSEPAVTSEATVVARAPDPAAADAAQDSQPTISGASETGTALEPTAAAAPVASEPVASEPVAVEADVESTPQPIAGADIITIEVAPDLTAGPGPPFAPEAASDGYSQSTPREDDRAEAANVAADPPIRRTSDSPPATSRSGTAPAADDDATPVQTTAALPQVPPPTVTAAEYVPRVFGQGNVGSRISVRAVQESWVQVTGVDNELLLTRILRPGDVYHVPDRPGLVLMTGNAGGIEIIVDGAVAPPLGPVAAVRRGVALDARKLLAGEAVVR